jgi:antitoxin component YwqK of YwqJK toxin-antitoxin module
MKSKHINTISLCLLTLLLLIPLVSHAQTDFNKLDSNGKKHGLWKGLYTESKRPKYEGTFEHGKETGLFNFFDDTKAKTIIATREFNSKDNSAYTIFYDQKSNIVSEGKLLNKLFEGEWKYYHQDSKTTMTIENYSKGKLQGLRTVFYANGKVAEEIFYKNNVKEGLYKKFTENGILLEESNFKNDLYNGTAVFRDSNGDIASQGKFSKGKKVEIWQFYQKGKLLKEVNMSLPENFSKSKI